MNARCRHRGWFPRGLLAVTALALCEQAWADTSLLREGRVILPVLVADEAAPDERAAARELARVLSELAGVEWPVRSSRAGLTGLLVGRSSLTGAAHSPVLAADFLAPDDGEWGPDAFRVRIRDGSIAIEAATPPATGYAVAWFLQTYAGVRWYAPGKAGEVIPRRRDWSLPDVDRTVQPAYLSREIYPNVSAEDRDWARRNGLQGRLEFSHALDQVFTPATLAAHPGWRPWVRGKREPVPGRLDRNWQPNLALPAVADHAARQALAAFAAEPERRSYSLGMNDSLRFDQGSGTAAVVTPLRYFRGMPDYSPLVFGFMNRAAHVVAATRGDRYLGCLAYFWCENVPPFRVNPQVVPYVTTDRSQYFDRAYRDADLALMTGWQSSGVRTYGLWDYAYGEGFLVPRIVPTALAEGIREGWHRGARGYFAELNPHAGFDAFKRWMLARLLWEPDLTVQELADDFFPGYYGRAAAPMRLFFDRCEAIWMNQSGPAFWLKYYRQADQALLFPPAVCQELREILTAAQAQADSPSVLSRIEQTSRAFAVAEAFARFAAVRSVLSSADKMTELALAEAAGQLLQAERELRRTAELAGSGEAPAMSVTSLDLFVTEDPVPRLLWLAGQGSPETATRILRRTSPNLVVPDRWWQVAGYLAAGPSVATANLVRNGAFQEMAPEGLQPGFLHARSADVPAGWDWQVVPCERSSVALSPDLDAEGVRILRIEGAWSTQFFQWIQAVPGRTYVCTADMRGASTPGGEASLHLSFLSASGEMLGSTLSQSLPKGTLTAWRPHILAYQAPPGTAWVGVGFGATRQAATDWLEVKAVALRGVDLAGASP